MISKAWMINGILAIVLVVCLGNVWNVWHTRIPVLPEEKSVVIDKTSINNKKSSKSQILKESAYESVVDRNLFSPDRAPAPPEVEVSKPGVQEDVRISGEKIVLYGVIMIDDYKKALINNPGDRKTGSKIQWVSEGDRLENLKVREIRAEEILLVDGADRYRVLLYDPDKAVKSTGVSAGQRKEVTQPKVISAGVAPTETARKVKKKTENVSASPESEYEIVDTPFGKLRRKRR